MIIIGELINGTRKRVAEAISARDADYIAQLAGKQAEAGADYIDANAGIEPGQLRLLVPPQAPSGLFCKPPELVL